MLERELEAQCVKHARKEGLLLLKLSPQYCPGLPDRLLIGPGGTVLVEFKRPGVRNLTKIQAVVHRKIVNAGGRVYVCNSIEGFLEIMSAVSGHGNDVSI